MSDTPIQLGTIDISKSVLLNNRLLIGIDSGSMLTKVIFLHKDNHYQLIDETIDFVTLNNGVFKNEDFSSALKWTRAEAYIPENSHFKIHITGSGVRNKQEIIQSIFGLRTELVDETLSIISGHKIAMEQIGLDKLIAPPIDIEDPGHFESKFLNQMANSLASKFTKQAIDDINDYSVIFPCLIHVYGSITKLYYFDEDGKGEQISTPLTGGAAFLGLAKCLLDTNIYNEIVEMASKGNRGNVDTQVKEILADNIDSPYGRMPPEIPVFSFGKAMDLNKGVDDFSKEDLARSLVGFISRTMTSYGLQSCQMKSICRIYLSGNIFQSNLFQHEIKRSMMIFKHVNRIDILNFGYFGALGAMLCNDDDKEKYCKN